VLGMLRAGARRPFSLMVVVFVALVVAIGGFAAVMTDGDEVTLRPSRGGPVQTTSPEASVEIPLSNPTFTQRAGEAVLLIAQARTRESRLSPCSVFIEVVDSTGEAGIAMEDAADRGSVGALAENELLPARATNTVRTLSAFATEGPDCDVDGEDTWTVSVNVSIVSLRN
jgi:hypothetical protein